MRLLGLGHVLQREHKFKFKRFIGMTWHTYKPDHMMLSQTSLLANGRTVFSRKLPGIDWNICRSNVMILWDGAFCFLVKDLSMEAESWLEKASNWTSEFTPTPTPPHPHPHPPPPTSTPTAPAFHSSIIWKSGCGGTGELWLSHTLIKKQ